MNSPILNQLNNLEREANPEVTKARKGRKKKTLLTINEEEENEVRDKRERPVAYVLSGNSKQYLRIEKNTLNSKLMKWTSLTSMYYYIGMNLFQVHK